jgi:hypothetical protein
MSGPVEAVVEVPSGTVDVELEPATAEAKGEAFDAGIATVGGDVVGASNSGRSHEDEVNERNRRTGAGSNGAPPHTAGPQRARCVVAVLRLRRGEEKPMPLQHSPS